MVRAFGNSVGINDLSENMLKQIDDIINKAKQEDRDRIRKFEEEKKKRELETRPDERTSYNPNTILKTKIDVTFPFGYGGQPSAEQQGSYLVTV
jgi:hypothetical protein